MKLDTRGEMFPEIKGAFFKVVRVPSLSDDGVSWKWEFETSVNGEQKIYKERLWPGYMPSLLRGLKVGEAERGVFDFEPTMVLGAIVKADIVHQLSTKGKNAGSKFPRMVNIEAVTDGEIPF